MQCGGVLKPPGPGSFWTGIRALTCTALPGSGTVRAVDEVKGLLALVRWQSSGFGFGFGCRDHRVHPGKLFLCGVGLRHQPSSGVSRSEIELMQYRWSVGVG